MKFLLQGKNVVGNYANKSRIRHQETDDIQFIVFTLHEFQIAVKKCVSLLLLNDDSCALKSEISFTPLYTQNWQLLCSDCTTKTVAYCSNASRLRKPRGINFI